MEYLLCLDQKGGGGLTVLVVEDDEFLRQTYVLSLEAMGLPLSVVTASNVFTALIRVGASRPDVIIADLVMADVDGFQMIRALKCELEFDCPKIVAISGLSAKDIEDNGGLPADVTLFEKPVPFAFLKDIFTGMLLVRS